MSTLEARSHEGRLSAGGLVLIAAPTTDTTLIKKRLAGFSASHRALSTASAALDRAEAKLSLARARVAERDVDQDEAIEALATAMVGDGFPRANPFKGLSPHNPSRMKKLAYAVEAKALHTLIGRVRKRKNLSPKTTRALAVAEKAAVAVTNAIASTKSPQDTVDEARAGRDALEQPWETNFAALKRAARSAEDDGARGLYDALFVRTAPAKKAGAKKPRAKKAPAKKAPAAPPTTEG